MVARGVICSMLCAVTVLLAGAAPSCIHGVPAAGVSSAVFRPCTTRAAETAPPNPCVCTEGWQGDDCSVPTEATCGALRGTVFDGTFVATAGVKPVQCGVAPTTRAGWLGLRAARVHMALDGENRAISLSVQSLLTTEEGLCSSSQHTVLRCSMTDCHWELDPEGGQTRYSCASVHCSACDADALPYVSLRAALLASAGGEAQWHGDGAAELVFTASQQQQQQQVASLTFRPHKATAPLLIALDGCVTGQCVSVAAAPARPVLAPLSASASLSSPVPSLPLLASSALSTTNSTILEPKNIAAVSAVGAVTVLFLLLGAVAVVTARRTARPQQQVQQQQQQQRQAAIDLAQDAMCYGLAFEEIGYSLKQGKGERRVLKGVSGVVKPGELVGIMGPSGAGKSSLLNILGGRECAGRVEGRVDFFALPRAAVLRAVQRRSTTARNSSSTTASQQRQDEEQGLQQQQQQGEEKEQPGNQQQQQVVRVGYVLQDEQLLRCQTVRETLEFAAKLRSPAEASQREIDRQVDSILSLLRLEHIADSLVGSADAGGISGGERRRLAIGIELVTRPHVLLLDEPTTGLDSHSAAIVMQVLRDVADVGCACLQSIHQPSLELFLQFDKILLMGPHGGMVYFGPPVGALDYFAALNHRPVAPGEGAALLPPTPPEFLLDTVSMLKVNKLYELSRYFPRSSHGQLLTCELAAAQRSAVPESCHPAESTPVRSGAAQLRLLLERSLRTVARDPTLLAAHAIVTTLVAVAMGLIFWQVDNKIPGMQNREGGLFFLCVFFALTAMSSLNAFVGERRLYRREYAAGFYSVPAYFAAQVLSDLIPLRVFPPFPFALLCYWMMGLQPVWYKFLFFLAATVLLNVTAACVCLALSSVSKHIGQANLLTVVIFIFCMLFGGLFLNNGSAVSTVCNYLSFMHYAYEALFVNEFDGLSLLFNPKGYPVTPITGRTIIENFNMDISMHQWDLLILACYGLLFLGVAFLGLWINTPRRTRIHAGK